MNISISVFVMPSLLGSLSFTLFGYILSRIFRRNDIADVLWGLGFLIVSAFHIRTVETLTFRAQFTLVLLLLWALRLSLYLGVRTFSKTEDVRYKNWRNEWGPREPFMAFFKVFLLQGTVMLLVSAPLAFVIYGPDRPLNAFDFLGTGLFLLGFAYEAIADQELFLFKRDKSQAGRLMMQGLWAQCRHPNYLGEILIWWGFGLIAFDGAWGALGLLSSALMTFLLMRVSGVPMLEKHLKSASQDFAQFIKATPALFPWRKNDILVFASVFLTFVVLDFFWLGLTMADFYKTEALLVARMNGTEWDVWLWPAFGVYIFLTLAVQQFAIAESAMQSLFKGFVLGLCIYGVYDLTNLSLLKNWSLKMALVDLSWGPFLCALAAGAGFLVQRRQEF